MKRSSSKQDGNALSHQLDAISLMHCKKHFDFLNKNIPEERYTGRILRTILFYCQENGIIDLNDMRLEDFKEIIIRLNKKGIEDPSNIKERTALFKNIKRLDIFFDPYTETEITPESLDIVKEYVVICPHCSCKAELAAKIDGPKKTFQNIYLCPNCGAYCGTHAGSNIPKGVPATKEERRYRMYAHNEFDKLWKHYGWDRYDAYIWLSNKMRLPFDQTHIGLFSVRQCKKVLAIVHSYMNCQVFHDDKLGA